MQKHIRYEIEIIADPSNAPSIHQVLTFFEKSFPLPASPAQPSGDLTRRGRPRKSPPAAADHSPAATTRPEEQLFTIRRTDTPVDVYFGELDEAVEKLKSPPVAPSQSSPRFTYEVAGVTCIPDIPSTITEIDETA